MPDPTKSLTLTRMSLASIRYSWRVSLSVALGVATATAVIAGALLVGDSMRGSLRGLTIERLGKTDSAIIPGSFFDADSVSEDAVALILFARGVVETDDPAREGEVRRAGSIQIVGCDDDFWDLDVSGVRPQQFPNDDGVVMNQSAADELGVKTGDLVTVRLPVEQAVPADSPLGRRDIQTEGLPRMKVLDVVPDKGLGRFSLSPSQAAPQIVFLDRATIGDVLGRDGQANALLFDHSVEIDDLNIDLAALGLKLDRVQREFVDGDQDAQTIYDYYSLTSDRLLLPDVVVDRVTATLEPGKVHSLTTYLANAIERKEGDQARDEEVFPVPYSTITAVDSLGDLPLDYSKAGDGSVVPMVLNSWAAERLKANVGTQLTVAYYEPEVENGNEIERTFDAVVTGIVPVTEPAKRYFRSREAVFDKPPTVYNDPDLTPTVPGVTDQDSISDWDLPFALKRKIEKEDDRYWNNYRLTPKAFLPLKEGQRLFSSRFGQTTSLRIDHAASVDRSVLERQILEALKPNYADLGWTVRHIRNQQLTASRGTTPFDVLFLSLSFFVILAAVMLIAMLFRLGLVERQKQFGTLLAIGWPPKQVAKMARREGFVVALAGVVLGLVGGFVYAKLVLWALRSLWVGAVTVPFLTFHWTPLTLVIGAVSGWCVAAITLVMTTRSLTKVQAQTLLSGRDVDLQSNKADGDATSRDKKIGIAAWATLMCALVAAGAGAMAGGQAAAGGFVGGGMLLLVAGLLAIYRRLRTPRRIKNASGDDKQSRYTLGSLASRNASRHPLRSTLTIGLMASASFLIIAISAFRLEPTEKGTGGFRLIGQSAQPLYKDLSQKDVQAELLGPDADVLGDARVVPMRLRLGQDASCNNLYQATQPTVLGVSKSMELMFEGDDALAGFEFFAHAEVDGDQTPWVLLQRDAVGSEENPIPMILDQNTAMYSLQMYGGVGEIKSFEYEPGKPLFFEVVGLLSNSLLQGKLMIGNDNFEGAFTTINGHQFFLIACENEERAAVRSALENRLGDVGMDMSDAATVLSGMLAVQNTYLRTFQSLGALGLLLGTIGLAVAQMRSVLERRSELAVLRAIGFTRARLAALVMSETASLLLAGIGCGLICAVLAVLPHAFVNELRPPIIEPIAIIVGIIVFGMLAGLSAVGRVVRMPLIQSLRSE